MASPLRELRRKQTERDIQLATLRLCHRHGLDEVTSEMIAQEAGISPRTFFNYFPNKETAAIGKPPSFPLDAVEAFVASNGPLVEDLDTFLHTHLAQLENHRDVLRALIEVCNTNEKLRRRQEVVMIQLRSALCAILQRRLPDSDAMTRELLADMCLGLMRITINTWLADEGQTLDAAFSDVRAHQRELQALMH